MSTCVNAELIDAIYDTLTDLNSGTHPRTLDEWTHIAERIGWKVRHVPSHILPEPINIPAIRRIYLPATQRSHLAEQWCAHEVIEALLTWEGREPFVAPVTPHEAATAATSG